jgi:PIN domain nuclease of toxin-antitoxin system
MDRMLIAAALTNNLVIVTNDRMIAGYGVPTVW